MKAPLNTDNWSGSIKSSNAPLNTDDWNGFISAEMSRKLSQNCQCIKAPCNCGAIKEKVYDNSTKDTVMLPIGKPNKTGEVKFGDPLKDKKWIVYGLIAVAGYFAYKKFKK